MDDLVLSVAALEARFRSGSARIEIIGLGYIGLPLVEAIAGRGHVVVGFDIDFPPKSRH